MIIKRSALCVLCTFAATPLAQAAEGLVAKQLAGPPSDFAAMRAPDPAQAAIYSKSALIPIEAVAGGWQGRLPVENGRLRFLVFGGGSVELAAPGGRFEKAAALSAQRGNTDFGIEQASYPADYYTLDDVPNGVWTVKVDGAARGGYVLLEGDDATELVSYQTHRRQLVGEAIGVAAALSGADASGRALLGNAAGRIGAIALRVTAPDGKVQTYAMVDDGRHGDGAAADGVYGAEFTASVAGSYLAQVVAEGSNGKRQALVRSAEHTIPVVEKSLDLATPQAAARIGADERYTIDVPVSARKLDQHYRAFAEVWGSDGRGGAVPVAWVGGMTTPKAGLLSFGLDPRWVARSGAQAPFELRNLRIEDPDHFVSVAASDRLPLSLPATRAKASASDAIDERMTMGVRPVVAKGVGQRLILVHGYCSGGVWPASQFSTASTFLDTNQNRSHDQFARLLQSFGNTWASFGTVAHSQGGAASLHLYTYYWSGLDYATGNRLIQSVGTPYQGTNLAGILATLGSWFGVGCGTNDNLSYSGASSWLAGIPNANRAKVNYYTTAFRTTNWWTNDYCNVATDLVLNDPEDGTTEQSKGQLPGAVNRGHTTGQCHTTGMRDPAQYQDSGRNSTMNANAAR